jgi:hypothetical protein
LSRSPIDRAGLLQALALAKTSAFRLETHPAFRVPEEAAALEAVGHCRPPDLSYHDAWLGLVRERSGAGVAMQRLRAHQRTLTFYQRVEVFHVYPRSVQAGEEIRLLELPEDAEPMRRDFWLIDAPMDLAAGGPDDAVPGACGLWLIYDLDGTFLRAEVARSFEVGWMCRIRREYWPDAVPLVEASSLLR